MNRVKILLCFFLTIIVIPEAKAAVASSYEDPDTLLLANTGIDIIKHAGGVWVATGAGVNFTFDSGQVWLLYDTSNGMLSDNLSSIFSQNNRLWVGSNHSELVDDVPTTFSDGLLYTDDLGDNWFQVDFAASGVDKLLGVNAQVFDITGHYDANQNEDWLFFSAFAGALVASRDGGTSWRRIYPSIQDSIKYVDNFPCVGEGSPCFSMRYFSCAADTSHGDTLFLWGGTAAGIFQYIFIPPDQKAFSPLINQIAFCDVCTDSAGSYVFIGGNNGLTRGLKTGGPFVSRFQSDGLPGPQVTAVTDFRTRLIVGTANSTGSSSTGLAYSDDRGDSFTPVLGFNSTYALAGNSNRIYDFAVIGERLYLAAAEAGLLLSLDSGLNWTQVIVDTLATLGQGNRRHVVYALNAEADTLRLGTDSGLVHLFMAPSGIVDSSRFYVFTEDINSSARVTKVRTQRFFTGVALDSSAIWTVNQRTTIDGSPIVARSNDGGLSWDHLQIGQGVAELSHDVNFTGDTVYIVGAQGVKRYPEYFPPPSFAFTFSIKDSVTTDDFDRDTMTTIEVHGDTIFIGTRNGFAISNARDSAVPPKFKITRMNTDSLKADAVIQFQYNPANPLQAGISGNFVPAMEVQYRGAEPAIVWASCRPTGTGQTVGITAGAVVPILLPDSTTKFERLWISVYDDFAWNFAFNGDTVFAATNNGLIFTSDTGFNWDTMQFIDSDSNVIYDASRPVFGLEVIDGNLWVGGEDRILIVDLDSVSKGFFVVDSVTPAEVVYAFPVPFSNVLNANDGITFRFVVEQDANVTIEVYDFAMNLVRRVIDNQFFVSDFYPNLIASIEWDALNGQGNQLAVGMYYFKVELSTGESRWGKLAIIP